MGKSSGSGQNTNTVVQQSQPPAQFLQAYQDLVGRATNASNTPLQQYSGPMVAGFSPNQLQAMAITQGAQGVSAPYTNAAAQMVQQSQTPLWPSLPQFDTSGIPSSAISSIGNAQQYAAGAAQPIAQQLYPFTETEMGAAQNLTANAYPYAALATQPINTTPTTSAVNQTAQSVQGGVPYAQAAGQAGLGLAGTVSPYTGFAQGTAQNISGQISPYTASATRAAGSAPGLISSYESPYTQQVTNALQGLFNQQNAAQQSQVVGNAAAQGAFGGDREAVAGALTAQSQALAENPQLAQVLQQGYQSSLSAAQQQAALQAQTGLGAGQLTSQTGLGAGQLGLGAGQLTSQAGAAGAQIGLGAGQTLGQLAAQEGQLQLGAGQLELQGQATQGQLGLGAGQLVNQAGLGQGQLAGQAGGLLAQGLTSQGQLGLGAAQTNLAAGQGLFGEFNQQQQTQLAAEQANAWLASQGAFAEGSLGSQAENQALQGASAEEQMGALQQQLSQEQLNIPYEQFLQQQAYPFQTTNFLAPIVEGLGAGAGGTSSTSYPGPSALSQVAGLGLSGAGLIGATGGFGSSGWLTGADGLFGSGAGVGALSATDAASLGSIFDTAAATGASTAADFSGLLGAAAIKRGGRIGYDDGGSVPLQPSGMPKIPGIDVSYIKTTPLQAHGMGPPKAPSGNAPQAPQGLDTSTILKDLSTVKSLGGLDWLSPNTGAARGGAMVSLPVLSHAEHHFAAPRIGSAPHFGTGIGLGMRHPGLGDRYQEGGDVEQPLVAAAPLSGSSPNVQTFYQRLTQMPMEQLQELSARIPNGSSQGQLIQRALMAKRMTPGAGLSQPPTELGFTPQQQQQPQQQGFAAGGSPVSNYDPSLQAGIAGLLSSGHYVAQSPGTTTMVNQGGDSYQTTQAAPSNYASTLGSAAQQALASLGGAGQNEAIENTLQSYGSGAGDIAKQLLAGQSVAVSPGTGAVSNGLQEDINLQGDVTYVPYTPPADTSAASPAAATPSAPTAAPTRQQPPLTPNPGSATTQRQFAQSGGPGTVAATPLQIAQAQATTPAQQAVLQNALVGAPAPNYGFDVPRNVPIDPYSNINPPTMPNVGQASPTQTYNYANITQPGISNDIFTAGGTYGGVGPAGISPVGLGGGSVGLPQLGNPGGATPSSAATSATAPTGASGSNTNASLVPGASALQQQIAAAGSVPPTITPTTGGVINNGTFLGGNQYTALQQLAQTNPLVAAQVGLGGWSIDSSGALVPPNAKMGGAIHRQDGGDISDDLERERQQDLADRAKDVVQQQRVSTSTAPPAIPLQSAAPQPAIQTTSAPNPAPTQPFNGLNQVENFWLGKGAPPQVAKAWAAEVNRESGGDPTKVGDSGTSSGAYQEHGDRQKRLLLNIQNNQAYNELMGGDPIAAAHRDEIMRAPDQATAQALIKKYFFRPASSTGLATTHPQTGTQQPQPQPGGQDELVNNITRASSDLASQANQALAGQRQQIAMPHHDTMFTNPWLALVGAGAGMLASRSPFPGVALGEGLETGLKFMGQQAQEQNREDVNDIRAQYQNEIAGLRQQSIAQQGQHIADLGQRYTDAARAAEERNATNAAKAQEQAIKDAELAKSRNENLEFRKAQPKEGWDLGPNGQIIYGMQIYNPDTKRYEFQAGSSTGRAPTSNTFQTKEQAYKIAHPGATDAEALEFAAGKKGSLSQAEYGRLVQGEENELGRQWSAQPSNIGKSPPNLRAAAEANVQRTLGLAGSPTATAAAGSPAPAQKTEAAPAAPAIPERPQSVPEGSAYSPSRKMWKSSDGALFDASGAPVQANP